MVHSSAALTPLTPKRLWAIRVSFVAVIALAVFEAFDQTAVVAVGPAFVICVSFARLSKAQVRQIFGLRSRS